MNKNLHDIDELFLSALERYKETPRAGVKQNIDAALDQQKKKSDKKRILRWKRSALLVLLLLLGLSLYESFPVRKYPARSNATADKSFSANANKRSEEKKDPETTRTTTATSSTALPRDPYSLITVVTGQHAVLHPFRTTGGNTIRAFSPSEALTVHNIPMIETGNHSGEIEPLYILSTPVAPERFLKETPLDRPSVFSLPVVKENIIAARIVPPSQRQKKKLFFSYWAFTPFISYEQVGYKLDSDDPVIISNIKHNEVQEPSYSGGILVSRQFSRHWGLQTGLVYHYTEIGISPQKIYAFQDPAGDIAYKYITSSGYAYIKPVSGPPPAFGDSITAESKHMLKAVHIPLMATYRLGKGKLTVAPGAGIEAGVLAGAAAEVELTDASNHETATVNKLSGTKKFYVSAAAAVEIQYKLNKKTSVTLQPVFRHALSPITENIIVETFPRSFGIRAGVKLRF
jgi:hypothetical protein